MLMRTARKGFPSSHTLFQALPMSALSPISLQLCCLLCFFGGEGGFKAACHKSPDILIVTGWSPVRRGFPFALWVGVNCSVAPGFSLKHVGEEHPLLKPSCVTGAAAEEGDPLCSVCAREVAWESSSCLLCWSSPWISPLGKKKKGEKTAHCLLERGLNGTKKTGMRGKYLALKHAPQLSQNF